MRMEQARQHIDHMSLGLGVGDIKYTPVCFVEIILVFSIDLNDDEISEC